MKTPQEVPIEQVLLVPIERIFDDKRSLTRITNLALNKKFTSKELIFEIENREHDTTISVIHKNRFTHKSWHFRWTIYLTSDKFTGISVQYLREVNYAPLENKVIIGKFIRSKRWVNQHYIDWQLRELRRQIANLKERVENLETFCPK